MPEGVRGRLSGRQRRPGSLFDLCLETCSTLVSNASSKLYMEYDDFEDEGCQEAIQKLQDFLIQTLPLRLFDMLTKNRGNRDTGLLAADGELRMGRITVSIFLHPRLTWLQVQPEEMKLGMLRNSEPHSDAFWIAWFRQLVNLTSLDMGQLATDEILEVVGQSCTKLHDLKFQPRLVVDREGSLTKVCVSLQGLLSLLPCRHLRRVSGTSGMFGKCRAYLSPWNGVWPSSSISADCLSIGQKFILGLPLLEDIDCEIMGNILHGGSGSGTSKRPHRKTTRLKVFRQFDPFNVHVPEIELECPEVEELILGIHWRDFGIPFDFQQQQLKKCSDIMEAIAVSKLQLTELSITDYPMVDLTRFFELKGQYLSKLEFVESFVCCEDETSPYTLGYTAAAPDTYFFNSCDIELMGQYCPNLKVLRISRLAPSPGFILNLPQLRQRRYFKQLKSLTIIDGSRAIDQVVPLFLLAATEIEEISLRVTIMCPLLPVVLTAQSSTLNIDSTMSHVLANNPMRQLKTLELLSPIFASSQVVREIENLCVKLKKIKIGKIDFS